MGGCTTNVPWSPLSCCFVCVFRFCLSADGKASGCDRVVITILSYAAQGILNDPCRCKTSARRVQDDHLQLAGSSWWHCSQDTLSSPSLGWSKSVPHSGQNKSDPDNQDVNFCLSIECNADLFYRQRSCKAIIWMNIDRRSLFPHYQPASLCYDKTHLLIQMKTYQHLEFKVSHSSAYLLCTILLSMSSAWFPIVRHAFRRSLC